MIKITGNLHTQFVFISHGFVCSLGLAVQSLLEALCSYK